MQRISTATKAADLFGAGKHGFKDGDLGGGIPATDLNAAWFNGLQEELVSIIEAAGIAPSTATLNQVLQAIAVLIRTQAHTAYPTTGAAGTYVLTPAFPITAYVANQRWRVKFNVTGIAANTINVSALGAKSLKQYDDTGTKVNGVVVANQLADIEYDGVDFVIMDPLPPSVSTLSRAQTYTAFTTTGAAPTFVLTPTPAITAYAANQRWRVKFGVSGSGANTLNVSGLGAKTVKQYDATGAKVNGVIVANQLADIEYDGVDFVILDPLPPVTQQTPSVRQTVLSGPVDANGQSAFGGATGSTTVTAAGTITSSAAADDENYTGSIVNPSWTGLSTNGTMYLYLDITAAGVVSTGSTALAPVYQWGGAYSITSGQHTYNIQEGMMKVGNGAAAVQVTRVFVGQVSVSGGVVTGIGWYALMGRYQSPEQACPASGSVLSVNHNIGVVPMVKDVRLRWKTAVNGHSVGDESAVTSSGITNGNITLTGLTRCSQNTMAFIPGSNFLVQNGTNGDTVVMTGDATQKLVFYASRGW